MENDVVYESFLWDREKEVSNKKIHGLAQRKENL